MFGTISVEKKSELLAQFKELVLVDACHLNFCIGKRMDYSECNSQEIFQIPIVFSIESGVFNKMIKHLKRLRKSNTKEANTGIASYL